jgi:VanZ family protein
VTAIKSRRNRSSCLWESPLIDVAIWLIALIATGLTVWYSLGPTPPGHVSDKDLHTVAYFVDTLVILLAVVWRPGRATRHSNGWMLRVALGLLIVGGVIEIAQGRFADRDAQLGDWVADAVGIGLALFLFAVLRWSLRGKPAMRS